ncbi:CLUMA_CG006658, isoform A [Clunio marinus]|uniref:CLUMA_CG006658, isoform A n=1 Tax=Clunio marinus TaxID=568069 RepID=A0A1J1HXY3_9DIPT|nr:CLUMA_CG006658, isoform A [Clunio marinus]
MKAILVLKQTIYFCFVLSTLNAGKNSKTSNEIENVSNYSTDCFSQQVFLIEKNDFKEKATY